MRSTDRSVTTGVPLLEVDPDLGQTLDPSDLATARRQAVLPGLTLDVGPWSIDQCDTVEQVRGEVQGIIVVDGALTIEATLGGRTCVRLIAQGELVLLDGVPSDSLPVTWSWNVVAPTRIAIFDARLLAIGQRWPALMSGILRRAGEQTRQTLLQQAISQLPRVEDRLLALLWTIADRQGIVRGDGVFVPFAVTHKTLAQMIGAQRPTVSLGLARLTETGALHSEVDGWLLHPASRSQLGTAGSTLDLGGPDRGLEPTG